MNFLRNIVKVFLTLGVVFFVSTNISYSQKVGFFSSDEVRDKLPDAKQADQRIRSIVDEWKRELEMLEQQIKDIEFEIQKNRLVWSDEEREAKETTLSDKKTQRLVYARSKFEENGEYDAVVKQMMQPVEEKIYAAIQEIAAEEGYDMIWDKTLQPLAYVNFKYDITVKILRKLGVDVDALEKDLQDKIAKDPRNKEAKSKQAPKRRTRTKTDEQDKELEKDLEREIEPDIPQPVKPDRDKKDVFPKK